MGRPFVHPDTRGHLRSPQVACDLHDSAFVARSPVFLLSPARSDGRRAQLLLNPRAQFSLAVRLREPNGAELGEVFSFLSGLYFRGKLTYARAFASVADPIPKILVITADRGLAPPEARIRADDLERFSEVDIAAGDERYIAPLTRDVTALASALSNEDTVVLLGSIATGKYVDALLDALGPRLLFPRDFVGRGDMSRGGLLLRSAREGRELDYIPLAGALRRGKRPPKLDRVKRSR
jgi:hypothetical protein